MLPPGRCAGLSWRGVSGAEQQQRETGGRRGWWLVGLLAVSGAAVGALAGSRLDPDVRELVPSLAVAGFGLGGVIGLLLLAPVGLWRAWRRRARRRAATPERADLPDPTGLWHTTGTEHEQAPGAAAEVPAQGAVEAPTAQKNASERPEEPASGSAAEEAPALTPHEPTHAPTDQPATETRALEPEKPPPPAGEAPGWYP